MQPLKKCFRCDWFVKEHNFKAIHNWEIFKYLVKRDVTGLSKNTILKQFTTQSLISSASIRCDWFVKEHNFKAIHNPYFIGISSVGDVTGLSKNTILKQFTTNVGRSQIVFLM